MRRVWKVVATLAVVLGVLVVVNSFVLDNQTKPAVVNAEGGEIVEVASARLQVVDQPATGPGPEKAPVVLLHCYACSLHWWDAVVPLINRRHRVIRVDLIGFGGSQKPRSGYEIESQANAAAEALNGLGVEGAVVVGHSMGGQVATQLAESASQIVDRVAVIGTPATTEDSELPFLARLTYTPVLGQALWRVRTDGLIRSGYEDAFAPGFDFEAAFENPDQVVEDNRLMTFSSYDAPPRAADDFLEAESLPSRLTRAAVPFLAILGAEDQIVDTDLVAEEYAAVPGARIEVLAGVGHSPNVEAPAKTTNLLLGFSAGAPRPLPEPKAGPSSGVGERQSQTRPSIGAKKEANAAKRRAAQERRRAKKKARAKRERQQGKGSTSGNKGGGKKSGDNKPNGNK